ncbi:inner membrane NADH-quinone reductase [Haemophilus influenzae]|uniref:Inner membrane NADH-quinone reductase n=1 Tax=Haemophilus influenzae TaxID=727 RepID=A0A2X1RF07_HAEIF|nr:inner membrane NADH-quinone reductase [Haemophilus influenzae]
MTDLTEKNTALEEEKIESAVENQQKSIWKEIFAQGIWKNNPAVVQLLGLCPLLAVSSTATNALGLGLATMLVLTCTNTVISLFRQYIPKEIRIPIYVMIIATTVTAVQLLMNAYTYTLYQSLGIFYSINCDQLYYYRSRRSIRLKKQLTPFHLGWVFNGIRKWHLV